MATESTIQKWLEQVEEDISSAECLFQGGHWLYVGFLCHQAIEKMLKAYYMATHDDDARYTHSHAKLLEDCGLTDEMSAEHLRFLDFMVPMYIKSRYPEQKVAAARLLSKDTCLYMIKTTKEITKWIEQHLPSNRHSTSCENTSE